MAAKSIVRSWNQLDEECADTGTINRIKAVKQLLEVVGNKVGPAESLAEFVAKERLEDQRVDQLGFEFFDLLSWFGHPKPWSRYSCRLRGTIATQFVKHEKLRCRIGKVDGEFSRKN